MVREPANGDARSAARLTGRLTEYGELADTLAERPGLTVISADPWSGTTGVLQEVLAQLDTRSVLVDARPCADAMDLALAIADAALAALAPDALAWWTGSGPPGDAAGLRVQRSLSLHGVGLEELRVGAGAGLHRLTEAVELVLALSDGDALLAIDHVGLLLSGLPAGDARELLGQLRSLRQRHPGLDLLLVEHPAGVAAKALADRNHPLYRAGTRLHFRRPTSDRFYHDLAITRPWTRVAVDALVAAADLAAGVPELTWHTVELGSGDGLEPRVAALQGWHRLRRLTELSTAREWDVLRRVHPLAQPVVAAVGSGLPPHAAPGHSKSVNDALRRLRELGMAWQPAPRRWALANPLLAAWTREHPPRWIARRRGGYVGTASSERQR